MSLKAPHPQMMVETIKRLRFAGYTHEIISILTEVDLEYVRS
jgi:hypothetical protein